MLTYKTFISLINTEFNIKLNNKNKSQCLDEEACNSDEFEKYKMNKKDFAFEEERESEKKGKSKSSAFHNERK